MSYSRNSSPLYDLWLTIVWLYVLAHVVSSIFKIGSWLAAGILVGIWAAVLLIVHLVQKVQRWKALQRRCIHGVKRGKDGGCSTCALDELKRNLESKAYQAEQERKKEIRDQADELQHSELASLRKKWLSRSELYLQMNWKQFENAIAQLFKQLGYEVKQTPFSNDRGKDLIIWKNGEKYLVECKRYEADNKIGRRDLQIFVAAMKEENAKGGFYVNTGCFASTAIEYAKENNIELYDRHKLPVLVNSAYPVRAEIETAQVMCLECGKIEQLPLAESPSSAVCSNGHEVTNKITTRLVCSGAFSPETVCEECGSEMRLVSGRYRKFWGCSRYPKCRFTRRYKAAHA